MNFGKNNNAFWPSYVDIMTTLFAIMLILFAVSYARFKAKEKALTALNSELAATTNKYNELCQMYSVIENIDSTYFDYNEDYIKNIFKISIKYQRGQFDLYKLEQDQDGNVAVADQLREELVDAGNVIKETIERLQKTQSSGQKIKYLVVIEGQASADGYNDNSYFNNNVLSYQRALALHQFWQSKGIDFTKIDKCELVICGSGEGGVPRDNANEANNQRFLIHIVPVIGNIKQN